MSKYYVVWKGRKPGIYSSWNQCKEQVHKFSGAKFQSFDTKDEAQEAYKHKPLIKEKIKNNNSTKWFNEMQILLDRVVTELQIYRMRNPK